MLAAVLTAVLALSAYVWRIDILRTGLDPKQPFQIYSPPAAPSRRAGPRSNVTPPSR